jgi:hypothetical protein
MSDMLTTKRPNNSDDDGSTAKKIRGDAVAFDTIFALLPEECLVLTSRYMLPIETYNLCCTCRLFHLSSQARGDKKGATDGRPRAATLAKAMLNSSLTQGLENALARNNVGFDVSALQRLHDICRQRKLPPCSVLLSGSIVLQACIPERNFSRRADQPTDADFLCSRKALRRVRSWLVDESGGGMVFVGLKVQCYAQNITSFLESESGGERIDHVEAYGPTPSESFLQSTNRSISTDVSVLHKKYAKNWLEITQAWRHPPLWTPDVDTSNRFRPKPPPRLTRPFLARPSNMPWSPVADGGPCPHLDFNPLPGSTFPFLRRNLKASKNRSQHESDDSDSDSDSDFPHQPPNITTDLVVAKDGWSAQDLVDTFDLDICMCSYDGCTFRIKNPRFVFNVYTDGPRIIHMPMSNISRNSDILRDFFGDNFDQESTEERLEYLESQKNVSDLVRYLWNYETRMPSGIREIDSTHRYHEEQRFFRVDDVHQLVHRAVSRINKYRLRGINIVNSDHIPSEYDLPRHY